jgi:hypothetical protein
MPAICSYFNPCSPDFNSIRDFKTISCGKKIGIGLITTFITLIFAPLAISVFRYLVVQCTAKPVSTPTIDKTQQIGLRQLPTNVIKTVKPKLPLIKNLREVFGFDQPTVPLKVEINNLLSRVVIPPKQLLSYAIMQRNAQQLMDPKINLVKLGYTRYMLRLSESQTIEVYSSPFPVIAHSTATLSRILQTPLERGKVSKDKNFILNSCEKISTSILQQGIPAFGNMGSIILSVTPSAIVETSPMDASVPLMKMDELDKAYLILRNKHNALLSYLNEILRIAYLDLNREKPVFQSEELLHALDLDSSWHKQGIINKLKVLLKEYNVMNDEQRIQIAQGIFGKEINVPIDRIILGLIEQCEQITKCMRECIGPGEKEDWDIFLEAQQMRFGQINHFPLGPTELIHHLNTYAKAPISGVGAYTELTITSTKYQKEEDTPNMEIAAIGVNCANVEKIESGELILKGYWKDSLSADLSKAHDLGWRILLTHEA